VTNTVLSVYDIEERQQVAEVPSEMQSVTQGYTFFSPDSRYLVLTREAFETVLIAGLEEHRMVYTLQVLEIPSCRVIYESQVPDHAATTYAEHVLPNYYNGRASDLPANLFAPDSTKLLLPVSPTAFGVFDLEREEMLYTRRDELRFASFSPDSTRLLTLSRSGTTWTLREAASGVPTHSFYDIDTFFYRGFVWDGDTVLLAGNAGNSRFGGVYQLEKTVVNERSYFSDESGSYLKPAVGGALASVTSGQKTVALEGSADYDLTGLWAGAGAVAVGLSNKGTESVLTSWDAATGQVLARSLPAPELTYLSPSAPPSFALSADGSRVTAFYHNFGVEKGGFRTYDTVSGAVLAETGSFWLTDATLLFDRGVTRLLYIFDNTVTVYDCLSGAKLFTLDDYPEGENALGMWSGQVAAISDDGALLAISHSKKNTLEIIDTGAGTRLQEIPLSSAATTPPCFSHDGTRVTIGCGKTLLTAETSSGQVLYTIEDEDGFATAYKYSEDDLYLIGTDIRAADTGVTLCPTVLPAQPVTEINRALGVKIPVGYGHAVYLPSYGEALAALRACVREYTFTAAEKLRFSLD
jgi:WD40 repeat protein